jgi:DNA-binding CsgD family transcriptional regulator
MLGELERGWAGLLAGDWQEARGAFSSSLSVEETAPAWEGMSQALWWAGEEAEALAAGERAHHLYRRRGDLPGAVRTAIWVSNEYRRYFGNRAVASNGWLGRAQRLAADDEVARGWVAAARAEHSDNLSEKEARAEEALAVAERHGLAELECYALAQLGLARVAGGDVTGGLALLDEAMALASSQSNPLVAADTACTLMEVADLIGDLGPFMSWAPLIEKYLTQYGHHALIAVCGACCGEVFSGNGDFAGAERELVRAIAVLEERGQQPRCSHPSARLGALRVRQGRLEEAEAILAPIHQLPEAIPPLAMIHLARRQPGAAARLLERRIARLGEFHLASAPLLLLLSEAFHQRRDAEGAWTCADRLAALAARSGLARIEGLAGLARARATAISDPEKAPMLYEEAIRLLDQAPLPMEGARGRLEMSRLLATEDRDLAVAEARAARAALEGMGASLLADEAAGFLRSLGVRRPAGVKGLTRLTQREAEVLQLIAAGLSNAEISDRLFISQKTAANHVSNVLLKLGVRSRTEAASLALRSASGAG